MLKFSIATLKNNLQILFFWQYKTTMNAKCSSLEIKNTLGVISLIREVLYYAVNIYRKL